MIVYIYNLQISAFKSDLIRKLAMPTNRKCTDPIPWLGANHESDEWQAHITRHIRVADAWRRRRLVALPVELSGNKRADKKIKKGPWRLPGAVHHAKHARTCVANVQPRCRPSICGDTTLWQSPCSLSHSHFDLQFSCHVVTWPSSKVTRRRVTGLEQLGSSVLLELVAKSYLSVSLCMLNIETY